MPSPAPEHPPTPGGARSWPEFTLRLRELYEWSGSPKYRALCSRVAGLSPAAVSTLIGKNPLSQPPETATQRFVLACLTYRDLPYGPNGSNGPTPAFDIEAELARWTGRWKSLAGTAAPSAATFEANGHVERADVNGATGHRPHSGHVSEHGDDDGRRDDVTGPDDRAGRDEVVAGPVEPVVTQPTTLPGAHAQDRSSHRRRRPGRVEVALIAAAVTAAMFVLTGFLTEKPPDPDKECLYVRGTLPDTRLNVTWSGFFQCPNKVGAAVYAADSPHQVIGYVDTDPARFMCWTRGVRHSGSNVWYYTHADRLQSRATDLSGWGFVHAADVQIEEHPAPNITRECDFM